MAGLPSGKGGRHDMMLIHPPSASPHALALQPKMIRRLTIHKDSSHVFFVLQTNAFDAAISHRPEA